MPVMVYRSPGFDTPAPAVLGFLVVTSQLGVHPMEGFRCGNLDRVSTRASDCAFVSMEAVNFSLHSIELRCFEQIPG
jgi:hypothetical protein